MDSLHRSQAQFLNDIQSMNKLTEHMNMNTNEHQTLQMDFIDLQGPRRHQNKKCSLKFVTKIVLFLVIIMTYVVSFYALSSGGIPGEKQRYGGQYKYLTIIDLVR